MVILIIQLTAERIAAGELDTPLEMDKDNIFGAFSESFDIMREELKAEREREQEAVRSRKEMIASLSHDIKTPVASIKAMADVMELTADTPDERSTLHAINEKADCIDRLVSNLFHATLEELNRLPVSAEPQSIYCGVYEGEFGIKKAMGFTSRQLRLQLSLSLLLPAISAALLGSVGGYFLVNPLFNAVFSSYGIKNSDLTVKPMMIAITALSVLALVFVLSFIMSRRMKKVAAYKLISE